MNPHLALHRNDTDYVVWLFGSVSVWYIKTDVSGQACGKGTPCHVAHASAVLFGVYPVVFVAELTYKTSSSRLSNYLRLADVAEYLAYCDG